MNDCAVRTNLHSCVGLAKEDNEPDSSVFLPKGLCPKIAKGTILPITKDDLAKMKEMMVKQMEDDQRCLFTIPLRSQPAPGSVCGLIIFARSWTRPRGRLDGNPSGKLFRGRGAPLRILERIRARYPLSFHGVGLSLGSTVPIDRIHLHKLKALVDRFEPAFVSEHLSWSSVSGRFLHELLPLPSTEESLNHVCSRIDEIQNVLQRPLLIENITRYLTRRGSTIPEGEFIAKASGRTGCGILLDLNNVYVNAVNCHLDPFEFLNAIPDGAVWEIHLAGFDRFGRWLIDTHGETVYPEVWGLHQWAIHRFGPRPTLIEWDTNMPTLSVLIDQAKQADAILGGRHVAAS